VRSAKGGLAGVAHPRPDMDVQTKDPIEEIRRLQRCINDLVSVLALPAAWSGSEPSQIVHSLLDALLRLLRLDVVYVRLNDPAEGAPIDVVKVAPTWEPAPEPQEICEVLRQWLEERSQEWSSVGRSPLGDQEISLAALRLELHATYGVMVAGSRRPDFPAETEKLVLSVAANQGTIGLEEARLRNEQKRVAGELDRRVAQRTKELAEANEELRKEIAERKLAEERLLQEDKDLKSSEAHKAAILNSSLDCVIAVDHESRITEFNPAAERTFGYRRGEVVGRYLADVIIPPSLRERHREGFARHLATGESRVLGRRLEMTARCADGREIPVELTITRISQEGPPCFTGYVRDITERKRGDDALREAHARIAQSEERWRSVFENSAVGIALTDLNGRFIATNPVYQKMLGFSGEELKSLSYVEITHEEQLEPTRALVEELLQGKRRDFQIEKQYRRKNGSLVWVRNNISIVPGTGRVPRFLMAIVEDISERKQAEERLQRSEAFLAEGQHLSRTGSFSWRVETGEIIWSEELYRIFGFEEDAPITLERIGTRIHPEDLPILNQMLEKAQRTGSDFEYEPRLRMPDQSVKYVHLTAHGTRDREGRLEYIGAAQDVTQRRLSEEALAQARSELANVARVTSLGVLTASIAHEVNQPLSGIITNASTCLRMLSADPPNVDGARETARRTIRDGNRASDVISRLRTLYSKKDLSPESMNLNEATREVISLSLSEWQRDRLILRLELADDLPPITGDRIQLQQVILNLIRNASDAMSTVDNRPRELLIRTEPDAGDWVRLSVKDSGVGFEPEAAEKLFQAFYTTKGSGMGIGLSVSRSIIEAHRGRLWAKANDGPGATFSFSIPCRTDTKV
jgi:PAS domain S-box-containing protein